MSYFVILEAFVKTLKALQFKWVDIKTMYIYAIYLGKLPL